MNEFFIHEGGKTMYIVFLALVLIFFATISLLGALDKKNQKVSFSPKKCGVRIIINQWLCFGALRWLFSLCVLLET